MFFTKGDFKLKFDEVIETESGYVAGVRLEPREEDDTGFAALSKAKPINIQLFHEMLSHEHEAATKATANYYGVKLTGTMGVCEDCATAKARQKNLNRGDGKKRATEKGQRLYFDISSIKNSRCFQFFNYYIQFYF